MRTLPGVLTLLMAMTAVHAAAPPAPAVNAHGDPLPHGAIARLGTLRWRTSGYLTEMAYSPDGKFIATADNFLRTARLIDAKTGARVRQFWGHRDSVVSVAFSSDGKRLYTAGRDRTARAWDVATGEQLYSVVLTNEPQQV